MDELERSVDGVARDTQFSGVVRIDRKGVAELVKAYGLAHRGAGIANRTDTQFAIASGTKSLTALTVVNLVDEGKLALDSKVRAILGDDLPLIGPAVTIEQLLAHRSGIGDYLDEDTGYDFDDYVLTVPVHELATAEQYLRVLDGFEQKFEPGERFAYCNGGYVVLALIAERVSGVPYHDLVAERVCRPAAMVDTVFARSDEPAGRVALGYLTVDGPRTNILHLPVRGVGDGGIVTTAADVHALWDALLAGRVLSEQWVSAMHTPRSEPSESGFSYGLGFWLRGADEVLMEGCDAGMSFRSVYNRSTDVIYTVLSNTTDGAWPMTRHLESAVGGGDG